MLNSSSFFFFLPFLPLYSFSPSSFFAYLPVLPFFLILPLFSPPPNISTFFFPVFCTLSVALPYSTVSLGFASSSRVGLLSVTCPAEELPIPLRSDGTY